MKNDISIIIAHYNPINGLNNPLIKTLNTIENQKANYNIEVIIADDGSSYSNSILNNYSTKINIENHESSNNCSRLWY